MFKNRYSVIALLLAVSFALIVLVCKAPGLTRANNPEDGVYVLCYHSFTNHPHEITFPIRQLDLQMATLKNAGFNFITTEDLIAKRYKGMNNVLITTDDGNKSVYRAYYEVFKKYNIKPLIAIYPVTINKKNYALTWKKIAELHKEGCYIASHGYYHIFLNEKAYKKNPGLCRKEVTRSKKVLEYNLGFNIDIFVYPYGKRCYEIVKLVEETGYNLGFTIEQSPIFRNDPNINRFELPRYMATNSNIHKIFEMMFKSVNKTYEPNPELTAPPKKRHSAVKGKKI